jgi:uncharacterized alkaline shock family protein YloU
MPVRSVQGRSLVSHRAIVEIVRTAVLGSYGVTGFVDDGPLGWVRAKVGLSEPGIRVSTKGPFAVDLGLTVAYGLPVAEVARQVDSAVRYAIRQALGRELDTISIHVGGLNVEPSSVPPPPEPTVSTPSEQPVAVPPPGAPVDTDGAAEELPR